ncbi:DHH family phosphoesterase [Halobaculum sp. MBLA0147]|uniref:DHH family phosphoesterase n=1 Tax=Halobaculum sp. MBLA0147 TaxID=3079934 RepID=UPI003524AB67
MDDALIDDATLPLDRKSRLPGEGFFYPDSLDEDRAEERAREALDGADTVVITDSDADGLACVALIREALGAAVDPEPFERRRAARVADDESVEDLPLDEVVADTTNVAVTKDGDGLVSDSPVALLPASPRTFADQLERTAEYLDPGTDVFVCDICPDELEEIEPALGTVVERAGEVRWFDHHQWPETTAAGVREYGIELVVGESDEECSADVTLRSLGYDFSERFETLAAVTRDHDLWLKADERSDDLADYAVWTSPDEYAAVIGAYGVDLPASAREYLASRREEKTALIETAVDRASTHEVGEWTVAVTYGRCSQNEVAETLRERGADASVIVKPAGSVSIRGTEGGFERAHEVARLVNGGGHPQAAGCMPDIYDDMLDYAHHWSTEGAAAKRVLLAAFERVAERAAEEADGGSEREDTGGESDDETGSGAADGADE